VQKRRECVVDPGKRSCRACATSKQKCDLDGNESGKAVPKRRVAKKPRIVPSDSDDNTAPENGVSYDFWRKLHEEDRAALREVHAADRAARKESAKKHEELMTLLIGAVHELTDMTQESVKMNLRISNRARVAAVPVVKAECGVNTERTADADTKDGAADETRHGPEVGTNGEGGAEREEASGSGSGSGRAAADEDETMEE
jgi:hypothetical protein